MKLMITGSRRYDNYEELRAVINHYQLHCEYNLDEKITLLLHGGAAGADALAARYAQENGIVEKIVRPNYKNTYYKAAPLLRNTKLVAEAEAVICFYANEQSGGTHDTAKKAMEAGKETWEVLKGRITKYPPIIRLGLVSLTI